MTRKKLSTGFTIVELLIVVVVIAILAAITIVAYNGIQSRAVESSIKADLRSVSQQLENDKTLNGAYPTNAFNANNGQGLKTSVGNVATYASRSNGYCVAISRQGQSTSFYYSNTAGAITSGSCPIANDGIVSTFAGAGPLISPGYGYVDGNTSAARFESPTGIDIDSTGNLYVADTNNNRIRKISTDGSVTTIAGSGTFGFANGAAATAQFAYPMDVAVGSDGAVYVADLYNYRVRKINTNGTVSTLAGSGSSGSANGTGTAASFQYLDGIDVDTAGNVYVADSEGQRIRKITSAGVVTTLAGSGYYDSDNDTGAFANGTGTAASFSFPKDVVVDSAGNVYVADYANHVVRKITSAGVVTTYSGNPNDSSFVDGTAANARYMSPTGVTIDKDGNVYVAEDWGAVRKITPAGVVSTLSGGSNPWLGGYVNGAGASAQFRGIQGISVDSVGGLYVADYGNHVIRKTQ